MDKLKENVLQLARQAQSVLDDGSWLEFAKLCQWQRYELNELVAGKRQATPVNHMRIAAALEQVGLRTRLSELDPETRTLVMHLGTTLKGEIKDYFPQEWHREHFTKYVCKDVPYTADMRARVHECVVRLQGRKTNTKVAASAVPRLKHLLTQKSLSEVQPAVPRVVMSAKAPDPKRVQRTTDSIYSSVNSLSNIAGANLCPDEVSETSKINIAQACAKLLHTVGVTEVTLRSFQSRRLEGIADSSALSPLLALFPKTK